MTSSARTEPTRKNWLELVDLQRALRGLKPEERGLLAMRFAADFDSAEIAQQLGMSASGVRSRLARLLAEAMCLGCG
jgi:RNA polymerase sigma factor (sigma-70 family)